MADDLPRGRRWGGPPRWRRGGPPPRVRIAAAVLLALLQLAGTRGAAHVQTGRHAVDALAVALLVAGPALLAVLLPRVQLTALAVGAVDVAYLVLGYPYGPVFASLVVALVVAVAAGHRATAWAVAGAVVASDALHGGLLVAGGWRWGSFVGVVGWMVVVLAVAEVVRVRRERGLAARAAAHEVRRRQAGEERLRIAQELHDVVAHHMSLINVQAGVALHLADRSPERVEPALRAIRDASKEALTELRTLVDVLRGDEAAPRSPTATLDAVDDIVTRSRHAGLEVTRTVTGSPSRLPAAVDLAGFRIVQEAVTNVVRHSGARRAVIALDYRADALVVTVDDDGRGRTTAEALSGNGIRGMEERAAALGGRLELRPSPLGGLRVEAALPLVTPGGGR